MFIQAAVIFSFILRLLPLNKLSVELIIWDVDNFDGPVVDVYSSKQQDNQA